MVSHGSITCNTAAADCSAAGGSHYPPGYVYSGNGCCLCEAGCDHSKETGSSCTYYDTQLIGPSVTSLQWHSQRWFFFSMLPL